MVKLYRNDEIVALSAGLEPSGKVNPRAIELMEKIGYDNMKLHTTKAVTDVPDFNYDYIITLGTPAYISEVSADKRLEWRFGEGDDTTDPAQLLRLRDKLLNKVLNLVISISPKSRQEAVSHMQFPPAA